MIKNLIKTTALICFTISATMLSAQPGLFLPTVTNVAPGSEFVLPVEVENFNNINSVQFAVQWDPEVVTLLDIVDINLPNTNVLFNFNWQSPWLEEEGILRFSWIDPAVFGESMPDMSSLFSMKFVAIGPIGSESPVDIISDVNGPIDIVPLPIEISEMAQNDCIIYGPTDVPVSNGIVHIVPSLVGGKTIQKVAAGDMLIDSDGTQVEDRNLIPGTAEFKLHQNFPNPWVDKTIIPFDLPEAGTVSLRVFDANGRMLYTTTNNFDKGSNQFELDSQTLNTGSSRLHYQLETSAGTQTLQMLHVGQ
ncbi:MAG: cohesin domain-containing protein [Saprospiraceae bacterium]